MKRKDLLLWVVMLGLVLPLLMWAGCQLKPDPLALLWSGEELTLEQALSLALELDRIADGLEAPPMERTPETVLWLSGEIAPYFYYEGITDHAAPPFVEWTYYPDEANFHVAGRFFGSMALVTLNVRYSNGWSRWSHRSYLATLVHEIGHSQGIIGYDPLMEPTTQLATLEVLASMARDGNVWAFPAFVEELRDYTEDYAWSLALEQDRLGDFLGYVYKRANNEFEIAQFRRSLDHWLHDMDQLRYILHNYGRVPFVLTREALHDRALTRCELRSLPNQSDCLRLNDAAYLVRHLRLMAADYDQLLAQWGFTSSNDQ